MPVGALRYIIIIRKYYYIKKKCTYAEMEGEDSLPGSYYMITFLFYSFFLLIYLLPRTHSSSCHSMTCPEDIRCRIFFSKKLQREREKSFLAHNVLFMATYSAAASAAVRTITQRCAVCVLKMRPLAQTPDAAVYSVVIAYPSSMLLSIFLNSYPHIMLLTSFNCSAAPIL